MSTKQLKKQLRSVVNVDSAEKAATSPAPVKKRTKKEKKLKLIAKKGTCNLKTILKRNLKYFKTPPAQEATNSEVLSKVLASLK